MSSAALSLQIPDEVLDFTSWDFGDCEERLPVTPLLSAKNGTFETKTDGLFSPIDRKNQPGYDIQDGLLSLKNETFGQFDDLSHLFKEPVFCDWVSIYQHHAPGLPKVNDGAFVRYDGDGVHQSTTLRKLKIEGSHV